MSLPDCPIVVHCLVEQPGKTKRMYASEALLSEIFNNQLLLGSSPLSAKSTAQEFYYTEGKTDVIAVDKKGDLFAFELKLAKWRQALHQAYRNASFAHYSYVVLPAATARLAFRMQHEFKRRGVGLCSVDDDGVRVEISAQRTEPLRPWLTTVAIERIEKDSRCINPVSNQ